MFTTVPGTGTDNRLRILILVLLTIFLLPLGTEGRYVRMSSFTILVIGILIVATILSRKLKARRIETDIRSKEKDFEGIFGKTVPKDPEEARALQAEVRLTIVFMTADCLRTETRRNQLLGSKEFDQAELDSTCQAYNEKYERLRKAFELAKFFGLNNRNSITQEGS